MKLAILGLACVVAAAQTTAHSGQTVSYQYAVGQELGFGGPEAEGEESGSAVTPAVLDRLRREAGAGKKGAAVGRASGNLQLCGCLAAEG